MKLQHEQDVTPLTEWEQKKEEIRKRADHDSVAYREFLLGCQAVVAMICADLWPRTAVHLEAIPEEVRRLKRASLGEQNVVK